MNIKEMHYDFKIKRNVIDSNQYRQYIIPEIDWLLNEAINIFIKMNVNPRYNPILGFEKKSRSIDEIYPLVQKTEITEYQIKTNYSKLKSGGLIYTFQLPQDYNYFVKAEVIMNNTYCGDKYGKVYIQEHDDDFELSPFNESSYEWGECNAVFEQDGINIYTDGNFSIKKLILTYIMHHPYVHNAEDYSPNGYRNLQGVLLTGRQDCILPENTHREIVDIAVALSSIYLQLPDYQLNMQKLTLT